MSYYANGSKSLSTKKVNYSVKCSPWEEIKYETGEGKQIYNMFELRIGLASGLVIEMVFPHVISLNSNTKKRIKSHTAIRDNNNNNNANTNTNTNMPAAQLQLFNSNQSAHEYHSTWITGDIELSLGLLLPAMIAAVCCCCCCCCCCVLLMLLLLLCLSCCCCYLYLLIKVKNSHYRVQWREQKGFFRFKIGSF